MSKDHRNSGKKGKPVNRESDPKKQQPDVRVWRFDRPEEPKPNKEEEFKKRVEPAPKPTLSDKPTGRKLWVKGTPGGAKVVDAPPAGYEKHRDVQVYVAEEQEKLREQRQKERAQRKKFAEARKAANKARPKPVEEIEEPEVKLETINALYLLGLAKMPVQRLVEKLVNNEIKQVIDMRSDDAMNAANTPNERDLAILLKEAAGIEYRRDEMLVPKREITVQFEKDKNWKRFVTSYADQLSFQKVEKNLSHNMFLKNRVVFLSEAPNGQQDQRHIAATYLSDHWDIGYLVEIK